MGRYINEIGSAASSIIVEVTGNHNAAVGERILADVTGGGFTITLPANASLLLGDQIQIIDVTSQLENNNILIDRNGSNIQGNADDLTLDISGASVILLYTGATYGWVISST